MGHLNRYCGHIDCWRGTIQEALPLFKTALEANPSIGQFWLSYIDTLIKLGRLAKVAGIHVDNLA